MDDIPEKNKKQMEIGNHCWKKNNV
jgi:hypothetical protein